MTQTTTAPERTRAKIAARTLRTDPWWRAPAVTAVALTIWVLYAVVHVFLGRWYWVPRYHYLTPFYSPCVSGACAAGASSLGTSFPKVPSIVPYAIVSLPFILGFRLSCYYYRGAYYRAFWQSPTACAVRSRTPATRGRPGSRSSCRTCTGTSSSWWCSSPCSTPTT